MTAATPSHPFTTHKHIDLTLDIIQTLDGGLTTIIILCQTDEEKKEFQADVLKTRDEYLDSLFGLLGKLKKCYYEEGRFQ